MSSAFMALHSVSVSVEGQSLYPQPILFQEGADIFLGTFVVNVADEDVPLVVVEVVLVFLEEGSGGWFCWPFLTRFQLLPLISKAILLLL